MKMKKSRSKTVFPRASVTGWYPVLAKWTLSLKWIGSCMNAVFDQTSRQTTVPFSKQEETVTFGLGCRPMTRRTGPGGHLLKMACTLLKAAWRTFTEFTSRIWSPRLGKGHKDTLWQQSDFKKLRQLSFREGFRIWNLFWVLQRSKWYSFIFYNTYTNAIHSHKCHILSWPRPLSK